MQGGHQVAQKSIRTTLPARSALLTFFVLSGPSSTVRVKSGAGLPTSSWTASFSSPPFFFRPNSTGATSV